MDERLQAIATAITAELELQGCVSTPPIDVAALAAAIEQALTPRDGEGRHPDELNATNDD